MRSTFAHINTAQSGLSIAQRQLGVTAHNLANANVPGYSRQRYVNNAFPPIHGSMQFTSPLRGQEGNGVESLSLDKIRDRFLDREFRTAQTPTSYWNTRANAMFYVEDIFNNIDSNSLDGVFASFFNSIHELSMNPVDEAIRTHVASQARRLVDVLRTYDRQLTSLMEQQNFMIHEQVRHTNRLLDQVTGLNEAIFRFELGGSVANDLRDQRELILDELSSILDISYEYVPFDPPMHNIFGKELTQLKVYAGSMVGEDHHNNLLIWHLNSFHMILDAGSVTEEQNPIYHNLRAELETGEADHEHPFDPRFRNIYLSWQPGMDGTLGSRTDEFDARYDGERQSNLIHGERFNHNGTRLHPVRGENGFEAVEGYRGGILQSFLDMRDGRGVHDAFDGSDGVRGIPFFLEELNRMVGHFVTAFNAVHIEGHRMPNATEFGTHNDFFDPAGLTARTISLSDAILASSLNIGASSEEIILGFGGEVGTTPEHSQAGNNEIALRLIAEIKEAFIDGLDNTVEGFYKNFLGTVASETADANAHRATNDLLLHGLHTQRTAISSVSEDEEMANMIRFQHAYNAASRTITTLDEMLDRLINATGRVGL